MTIGPEPMINILWMSLRFGILVYFYPSVLRSPEGIPYGTTENGPESLNAVYYCSSLNPGGYRLVMGIRLSLPNALGVIFIPGGDSRLLYSFLSTMLTT